MRSQPQGCAPSSEGCGVEKNLDVFLKKEKKEEKKDRVQFTVMNTLRSKFDKGVEKQIVPILS